MIFHVLDDASTYHVGLRVLDRRPLTMFNALTILWLRPFGVPDEALTDMDKSFIGPEFSQNLAQLSCVLRMVAGQAHHLAGKCEKHGYSVQTIAAPLVNQFCPTNGEQLDLVLLHVFHAKNTIVRRAGSAPA